MKVSKVLNTIISSTPYLEYYMQSGILNYSALAKKIAIYLKNNYEEVTESSVLMGLKRFNFPFDHKRKYVNFYILDIGQVNVISILKYFRLEKNNYLL